MQALGQVLPLQVCFLVADSEPKTGLWQVATQLCSVGWFYSLCNQKRTWIWGFRGRCRLLEGRYGEGCWLTGAPGRCSGVIGSLTGPVVVRTVQPLSLKVMTPRSWVPGTGPTKGMKPRDSKETSAGEAGMSTGGKGAVTLQTLGSQDWPGGTGGEFRGHRLKRVWMSLPGNVLEKCLKSLDQLASLGNCSPFHISLFVQTIPIPVWG